LSALQQPEYQDADELRFWLDRIRQHPPIVTPGEVVALKTQLAEASLGRRFVLHAGDCAERFVDCNTKAISDKLKIILQMSLVLVHGLRRPIVRIGRIAGQYAKPRSQGLESRGSQSLPSFRGDIINGFEFSEGSRRHQPARLFDAFMHSTFTMNHLRSLIEGGFADIRHPEMWRLDHIDEDKQLDLYRDIKHRVLESTRFMELLGGSNNEFMRRVDFFVSHEGLLLDYEAALTHYDEATKQWYDLSAHFLWIGERTRQLDGAHVEFFRGVANPIGIKIGPTTDPKYLFDLLEALNPQREAGRITLISRMGVAEVASRLPPLLEAVRQSKHPVMWSCDPMHGNAITTQDGVKTRNFDAILGELTLTEQAHRQFGSILGGVHFELTGENVTECTGGSVGLSESSLSTNYQTYCDPRLNYAQSMEMASLLSQHFENAEPLYAP
jgi:3-deoxy-7-phosphoheptulonate synthase